MGRSDAGHTLAVAPRRRRGAAVLVALVVVAALAVGVLTVVRPGWWRLDEPPAASPAEVPPPAGLELPPLDDPDPVAEPLPPTLPGALSRAAVRRALAPYLSDPDLGRHVVAAVAPLGAGAPVLTRGSTMVPASTTKLVTATAALLSLGPDATFRTRVVADDRGGRPGIVLVGGGDPLLASAPAGQDGAETEAAYPEPADVVTLAEATARALRADGVRRVRLGYDDTLFSGPGASPHWEPDYVPDGVVSPISALWVDEGRAADGWSRVPDPSAAAAAAFARALADRGVRVVGEPAARRAPAGAAELAAVESPPLWQIVERVLLVSDNEASEVLGHHVGLAEAGSGSFAGARRGVARVLGDAGVDLAGTTLYDGSGLSRRNRMHWRVLLGVLRLAAADDRPELRSVLTGLPVAAYTGSLAYRFEEAPAEGRGRVRAKTGTLTGVSSLAGIATDRSGNPMVFVVGADRIRPEDTLDARDALDGATAALGACRCGS